jgi:hypothetical protein
MIWYAVVVVLPVMAWDTNDWAFLQCIEKANLRFFEEQKYGPYHLVVDNADYRGWPNSSVSSVAGVGFELTAVCLGHYRGWISYSNAYEQVLEQVQAFNGLLSSDPEVLKRENGWTYHWYTMSDGYENSPDGLSLLDHSLFIAGCIFVSEYFKGTEAGELAAQLYEDTTWSWRPNSDYDFGYSENLLAVIESASAPQWAKGTEAKDMWNSYVVPWPRMLQFYFWQYPHCWVDFRFRTDERGFNHADIARDSILYQRQCAINMYSNDPVRYDMLGSNVWGWTAASASTGYRQMAPWGFWLSGEWLSEEHASDSGSVTPFALPPCMIYAPTETMAAMKHMMEAYYINGWDPGAGELPLWSDYGFLNCFNTGTPWDGDANHFWGVNAAIDYGPNILMLENYKMGSTWRWFMQNPSIAAGMYTVGFGPPQHVTRAAFSNAVNAFGGGLGHWENDGTPVVISYEAISNVNDDVGGYAVRIKSDNANEGGWIDLNGSDQRAAAQLSFWFRVQSGQEGIDVGLKDTLGHENKVRLEAYALGDVSSNWVQAVIPIEACCLTGSLTNDTWPGSLSLVSFAFTNDTGGSLYVDGIAFGDDTLAPVLPTNSFGVAMQGRHAVIRWDPQEGSRDLVGYHIWRRLDAASRFEQVTDYVIPAYLGRYTDTGMTVAAGQEVRYAIQAFDNAEPANASVFTSEKTVVGGALDIDWNNGCNPNIFGGSADGAWGGGTIPAFEYGLLPDGSYGWMRHMQSTAAGGGYIDLADGDASAYYALRLYIKGASGGEEIRVGLRDSDDHETMLELRPYLEGELVTTNWTCAMIPLGDYAGIDIGALRNISFSADTAADVLLAGLAFICGQRLELNAFALTEAEQYTRQYGASQEDTKAAASGGQVLGWGWGTYQGDFADYDFYLSRDLVEPMLWLRYACDAGDGRSLDVRWDDVTLGALVCGYTGGWGDLSNEYAWAQFAMPSLTAGCHKLTFYAPDYDVPVNLDCWRLADSESAFVECEDYSDQFGSATQDCKSGASGGEVLGQSWGVASNSSARYEEVQTGAHTGAWLHLWYALDAAAGCRVDVAVDSIKRARLYCPPTRGWGDVAGDFDRVSAAIGTLTDTACTVTFQVPSGGQAVNLDCFYIGTAMPHAIPLDTDGDGLSDRQETVAGTTVAVADTDGDGAVDGEEIQFGSWGALSSPLVADTDGDGQHDLQERIAGVDPADQASVFAYTAVANPTAAAGIWLQWPAAAGRDYHLYYIEGAYTDSAGYTEISDPQRIVTNGVSAGYREPAAHAQRYYRLEVRYPR